MKKIFCIIFLIFMLCTVLASCNKQKNCEHEWGKYAISKRPTCTEAGERTRICKLCELPESETLEASGHTYEDVVTTVPTCISTGVRTYTCKDCGDTYTKTLYLKVRTADEIFERAQHATGEIMTYNKAGEELALGTGIVMSSDGRILTNYHVIEGAYSIKIKIDKRTYTVQRVLAYDAEIDLAVLKISASDLITLNICSKKLTVGHTVYALGSSKGMTATFSQGIITAASRKIDGVTYVQHDAAISSGNSGGPLINEFGEIVGINTMTIRDGQNVNFAIFTSELGNLDYSKSMTVAEFYEKTANPIKQMGAWIAKNGSWDSENGEYWIYLGEDAISGYPMERYVYYVPEENGVYFEVCYLNYFFYIFFDEVGRTYKYIFANSETGEMLVGEISASTLHQCSTLSYTETNVTNHTSIAAYSQLAWAMGHYVVSYINIDFAEIGVSAAELGFVGY